MSALTPEAAALVADLASQKRRSAEVARTRRSLAFPNLAETLDGEADTLERALACPAWDPGGYVVLDQLRERVAASLPDLLLLGSVERAVQEARLYRALSDLMGACIAAGRSEPAHPAQP